MSATTVLGLTHGRATWAAELSRWSTGGALPVDFEACLTIDELRTLLATRRAAVVLVDSQIAGIGAELLASVHRAGGLVVGVGPGVGVTGWEGLGVHHELPADFHPEELLDLLGVLAGAESDRAAGHGAAATVLERHEHLGQAASPRARMVGVCGPGGTGASVVAMALAQGLADAAAGARDEEADPVVTGGRVVLIDGARRSSQAMYHDLGDVLPGILELADATTATLVDPGDVQRFLFEPTDRRYELLAGLRHAAGWVDLGAGRGAAALDAVRRAVDVVVVDHDPDLELGLGGRRSELAVRHEVARHVVTHADAVVVVAAEGTKGVHDAVRHLDELVDAGVPPERIVVCTNRCGRTPGRRRSVRRAVAHLAAGRHGPGGGPTVIALPEVTGLAAVLHDARPLPRTLVRPVTAALSATLAAQGRREATDELALGAR